MLRFTSIMVSITLSFFTLSFIRNSWRSSIFIQTQEKNGIKANQRIDQHILKHYNFCLFLFLLYIFDYSIIFHFVYIKCLKIFAHLFYLFYTFSCFFFYSEMFCKNIRHHQAYDSRQSPKKRFIILLHFCSFLFHTSVVVGNRW